MSTSLSFSQRLTTRLLPALVLVAILAPAGLASTFTVNKDGSAPDLTPGDGACAVSGGGCTLHAAIQEANNAPGGPHTINFAIAVVTPTVSLPLIQKPMTIDGAFGAPRVELVGAPGIFGLDVKDTAGGTTTGSGTTIKNLVIRNFGSEGIALVGGGHGVFNCYIGTDKLGTAAQANSGGGITITTTGLPFTFPPDLTNIAGVQIGDPNDPTMGNLISGNVGDGIMIFAQRTTMVVVVNNKIGTDVTGNVGLPNAGNGVSISGNAFGNTIGPNNIISSNIALNADGINIIGSVMSPNVVHDNLIGPSKSIIANLGNSRHGIFLDTTRFDPSLPDAAEIGPNNVIGYNGGDGIQITNTCDRVRVWGNLIGVGKPANYVAAGNNGNGIRITTPGHQIGGPTAADVNVISDNQASGILLNSTATDVVIQGNIIGRDGANLANFPNTLDGITIQNVGNNVIGGSNPGEANIIAGNGRHGVKVTSSGTGWANLITHNSIFGNAVNQAALGIDLDVNADLPDPADNNTPGQDPNTAYANYGQNAPVIGTGAGVPHYDPATGNTVINWTLDTSASTPVTLEFFTNVAPSASGFGEGETYLGTTTTVTDIAGHAAGTTPVTPPSPFDSRHAYVTMTATPTNMEPDVPGPNTSGPANNTSEFSNAVQVPKPGVLQFSAPTYSVNEGGVQATITVTRTGGSEGAVSIDYATSNGSAVQPLDYVTSSGTLNWADADAASKTFTVTIVDDNLFEGSETVNLTLTNPGGYAQLGAQATAVLTITDNDAQPVISINDVPLNEGNAGTTAFTFNITLSNPSAQTISVNWATADGTATVANADYVAASGTATFLPGSVTQPITVLVNGDTTVEPGETFFVNLTAPSNATILDSQGQGTIVNDDGQPQVSINDVALNEGNAGTTAFTFTVTLSNASAQTISVDYATADGTATTANADYAAASGTITFLPGVVSQPVTVNVNGDAANEPNETFFVNLTNPTNATILDNQGKGTIVNDDSPTPTFSISSVAQSEGSAGTTIFTFTVTLAPAAGSAVTVDATTADGTATTADNDYVAKTQTLNFPAGTTSQPFTVTVNGDAKFEPNETFTVGLSNNSAGTALSGITGTGTINGDDPQPSIAISDVSQNEGNAGTSAFTFNVTLSNPSAQTITVDYATADGTATTGNADYVATSGTLTFLPGVVSQPVTVNVNGDGTVEPNETFFVNLTNPANATIADNQGQGTILNDDGVLTPTFAINNVAASEGNAGATTFTFNVTLTPAAGSAVTVDATTADGTATTADNDYVAKTQTLNFPAGTTSVPFSVTVNGDTKREPNESFTVGLSNNSGGTALSGIPGTGTINNDDPLPAISINDVTHNEGNISTTLYTFTVTLSNPSAQTVKVDYATADGTATIVNSDYASTSGTLTFLPGVVSQPITVSVNGDVNIEPNETFVVNLTNPVNATIADSQGLGTILDDDAPMPTFSVGNVTQAEAANGTTIFTFTVTLSPAALSTVSVQASTVDGTATTADNDYIPNSQLLTFPPGTTTQPFSVTVNGDSKFESNETFGVVLSNPSPGTATAGVAGSGTITNDDPIPTISIGNISAAEGNAGMTPFTFAVTLSNASAQTITVNFATADGTATVANNDYQPTSGTVTFLPGVTTQTVTINVVGDTTVEPNETFVVNLTNPTNATIAGPQGTGTILDDELGAALPALNNLGLMLLGIAVAFAGMVALRRS